MLLLMNTGFGQEIDGVWQSQTFEARDGGTLLYCYASPKAVQSPQPLILFLHGAGERGSDNQAQLVNGGEVLAKAATDHNALVLAPQCPREDYWANVGRGQEPVTGRVSLDYAFRANPALSLQRTIALVDSVIATGTIDSNQIHLIGISMGGMGVLELASRYPGRWASVTSVAGTYGPQVAPLLAMTPRIRFYHGAEDFLVHVDITRALVDRTKAFGGAVEYTEYPKVNHGSWTPAFAEPDFLPWIFRKP